MILSVIGARPQFVKAAVISRALREAGIGEILIHTGQHYDANMSAVFFDELGVPAPRRNLAVGSGSHARQTALMLEGLEQAMIDYRPAGVVVYGDTNSTLAGALAAAKLGIPLAHVEAGLRSFRRTMPEEINRVLADRLADIHFVPTGAALANLRAEGISASAHVVGDVMLDAALRFRDAAGRRKGLLSELGLKAKGYVLATVHRAENTDDPVRLASIFEGLHRVAAWTAAIVPLHPRTRQRLQDAGLDLPRIKMIDPVGYLDMLVLLRNARLVVTDSGGVQKEAFFCRTPGIVVRDETEWVELVEMGWNRLVPPTSAAAVETGIAAALAATPPENGEQGEAIFGGGQAATRIANLLRDVWL